MNLTINNGLSGLPEKTGLSGPLIAIVALASKIKPLADIAKKVGQAFSKLGIGGVKDDRFINWRDKILDWLIQYGYGNQGETGLTVSQFGIDHSQVPDKKSNGNYGAEFQKLRKYVIARLNYKNPGLGDDWGTIFPEIRMFDLGGPVDQPFTALLEILKAVPPGQYIPGSLVSLINVSDTPQPSTTNTPDLLTQFVNGYKVVKDAAGKVKAVYDAAGRMINPGTTEYQNVAAQVPQQAGMGNMLGIGIAIAALIGLAVAGGSDKKKS